MVLPVFLPWLVFGFAHILSKPQQGVSGWLCLSLDCADRLGMGWFLKPLKREGTSASHQYYSRRRKPKWMLVLLRRGLDENMTNVLYSLSQWMSTGSGEISHGGRDLVVVIMAG